MQFQDVVGLEYREIEHLDETGARGGRIVGRAHDLDDLVDVEDRDEQPEHEVQAFLPAPQPELRTAGDDRDAVVEVDLQ